MIPKRDKLRHKTVSWDLLIHKYMVVITANIPALSSWKLRWKSRMKTYSIEFILLNWGSLINVGSLYFVTTNCPLPPHCFQQFLAAMDDANNTSNDKQSSTAGKEKKELQGRKSKNCNLQVQPKLQKNHLSGSFKLSGCQHIGHSLLRCDLQSDHNRVYKVKWNINNQDIIRDQWRCTIPIKNRDTL